MFLSQFLNMFMISIHSLYPEILLFENIKHCVLENSQIVQNVDISV